MILYLNPFTPELGHFLEVRWNETVILSGEQLYNRWIKLLDWRLHKQNYFKLATFAKMNPFSGVCLTIRRNCELHFPVVSCKKTHGSPQCNNIINLCNKNIFTSKIQCVSKTPFQYLNSFSSWHFMANKVYIDRGFLIYNFGNKNSWLPDIKQIVIRGVLSSFTSA